MDDKIVDLIAQHEGFSSKLYQCPAGKWTIGYGRNVEDNGIGEDEAKILLINDIDATVDLLKSKIAYFERLTPARQAVLIDMCFNMGWPKFSGFTETLRKLDIAMRAELSFSAVADEMLNSKWARQVKTRAKTLAKMMKTGEWV